MSPHTRKHKRKFKLLQDVSNARIHAYFTNEEIAKLKISLKIKDINSLPLVIAATYLNKLDLLKTLLEDGFNINQCRQSNMTALMWAVKCKHIDIVNYLLKHDADPTVETTRGDTAITLALENKIWDERSMINFWENVKAVSFVDVNFTNRNGHNILHMCVRRDWANLLEILLAEKPNLDAGNSNGVTPLMLACFRNNLTITTILIDAGADILKEDNHGRMTLCYAITSSLKFSHSYEVVKEVLERLKRKSSVEVYLKRRIELIKDTAKKSEFSNATSDMFVKIVQFAVNHIDESIQVFLDCSIFEQLLEMLVDGLEKPKTVKFLVNICSEILFYNEQNAKYNRMVEDFSNSGWIETVLKIFKHNTEESIPAFNILILGFAKNNTWKKILEDNCFLLLSQLNQSHSKYPNEEQDRILKSRKRQMLKYFENLNLPTQPSQTKTGHQPKFYKSKKNRRRSKTIKAKLVKIKSADFSRRLALRIKNQQVVLEPKLPRFSSLPPKPEEFIVNSLKHLLADFPLDDCRKFCNFPQWQKKILLSANETISIDIKSKQKEVVWAVNQMQVSISRQKNNKFCNQSITIVIDYLQKLLELMVKIYQEHWNCDLAKEYALWLNDNDFQKFKIKEKRMINKLQQHFCHYLDILRKLSNKNLAKSFTLLKELESVFLLSEIRGIKLLSYVIKEEVFDIQYDTKSTETKIDVIKHMTNVLNKKQPSSDRLKIDIVNGIKGEDFIEAPEDNHYCRVYNLSKKTPKNNRETIKARLKTNANGYHLINSIMAICDKNDSQSKRQYRVYDLNHSVSLIRSRFNEFHKHNEFHPKTLNSRVLSFQNCNHYQNLLGGQIRVAAKDLRKIYLISAGVDVETDLGLDTIDQLLAVKKFKKHSWLGQNIKNLVDPLMKLRNIYLLSYLVCSYHEDELILATQLCKCSLEHYIRLIKANQISRSQEISPKQLLCQFLDGLLVLHKHNIVHGNLKPSNIFIDFNGVVKIAEFGLYKALHTITGAPKHYQIWFAKETLEVYQNFSIMMCSQKSDVFVAAMVVCFVFTLGEHLYGDEISRILEGIKKGAVKVYPQISDLKDLVLWMVHSDCRERPSVKQILLHPYFWETSKKWCFILRCSGVQPQNLTLAFNVQKLHQSIKRFSGLHIKLEWHDAILQQLPDIPIKENNNLLGLLRFIRFIYEHTHELNLNELELSFTILSLFPSLNSALYQTLQHTNWFKHGAFAWFVAEF